MISYLQIGNRRSIFRFTFLWLNILFLLLSTLPVSASERNLSNAVYCPLQKKWVLAGSHQKKVQEFDPLNEICSSPKRKKAFLLELTGEISRLSGSHIDSFNNLYFHYARSSKRAFSFFDISSSLPGRSFMRIGSTEIRFNTNIKFDNNLLIVSSAVELDEYIEVLIRIPNSYVRPFFPALSKISKNINPRSPPAII